MIVSELFHEPNHIELESIIRRKNRLEKYHGKLYRELHDLRGIYHDDGITVCKHLNEWAKIILNLNPFDVLLYHNFIVRKGIIICNTKYDVIRRYIVDNNYVVTNIDEDYGVNYDSKFITPGNAIRWVICFRFTKNYFSNKGKNLGKTFEW